MGPDGRRLVLASAIGSGFTVYTFIQTDGSQMNATICTTASC